VRGTKTAVIKLKMRLICRAASLHYEYELTNKEVRFAILWGAAYSASLVLRGYLHDHVLTFICSRLLGYKKPVLLPAVCVPSES
jgi:hypothetical protein